PDSSWLSVPSGTSGTGSSVITIAHPDNYDAPRQAIVMVRWPTPTAGQNIRIAQAGCRYAVSRAAFDYAATGGTCTFDVLQQSDPTRAVVRHKIAVCGQRSPTWAGSPSGAACRGPATTRSHSTSLLTPGRRRGLETSPSETRWLRLHKPGASSFHS